MSSINNTKYWLALREIGIGYRTTERLLTTFGTVDRLWKTETYLLQETGVSTTFIRSFVERRSAIDPDALMTTTSLAGVRIIDIEHRSYPPLLKEIHSPPLVLFVRGNVDVLGGRCLAVVGTRKPTRYGVAATHRITGPLARRGITIVSGLAYGIDAEAHRAALEADGVTVAVLGSGIDELYPRANAELAEGIIARGGAIISEYPPRTGVQKHFFPQRNRIIAGLSSATLIVEAGPKSGALITARMALDENREVYAVPGPIDAETSDGPNMLIKNGANVAISADDLLAPFGLDANPAVPQNDEIVADSDDERTILRLLDTSRHIDELVAMSTLDTSVVNATLTLLEMKGRVRHLGGMNYIRTP